MQWRAVYDTRGPKNFLRRFLATTTVAVTLLLGVSLISPEVAYAEPTTNPPVTETITPDLTNPLTPEEAVANPESAIADPEAAEIPKSCSEQVGAIGWLVCPVTGFLAKAADWLFSILADLLLVQPLVTDDTSSTFIIWNIIRDLSNIIFIILILIMIFSQVTSIGISSYGVKKILPRIAAVAIIINLSYFICAIFVDLSNILGGGLKSIFDSVAESAIASSSIDVKALSLQSLFLLVGGGTAAGIAGLAVAGGFGGVLFLLVPVALSALVALLAALFTMAARQAIITLLVIVSPLAICSFLLPNTEKYFKKWKDLLMQMLILYPMFSVLFGAAGLAGWAIIASANSAVQVIFGIAVEFVPLILTPKLLKMSGTIAGKVNDFARAPFNPLQDKVKSFANEHRDIQKSRFTAKGMERKRGLSRFVTPSGLAATLAQGRYNRAEELKREQDTLTTMSAKIRDAKKLGRRPLGLDRHGNVIYARDRNGRIKTKENRLMRRELFYRSLKQSGEALHNDVESSMGDINKYANDSNMAVSRKLQGLSDQYKRSTLESVVAADQLKQITERNTNRATEQLNAKKMGWSITGYTEFGEPIYETNPDGTKRFNLNSRELRDEHITRTIDYRVETQAKALENTMSSLKWHTHLHGVSDEEWAANTLSTYSDQGARTYSQSLREAYRKESIESADSKSANDEFLEAYKDRGSDRYKDLIAGSADSLGQVGEEAIMQKVIRKAKEIEDRDRRDIRVVMQKYNSDQYKPLLRAMLFGRYIDDNGDPILDEDGQEIPYDTFEEDSNGERHYYFDMKDGAGRTIQRIYRDDKAAMKEFGSDTIAIGDPINSKIAIAIGDGGPLEHLRSTYARALLESNYNEHDAAFSAMMSGYLARGDINTKGKLGIAKLDIIDKSGKAGKILLNDGSVLNEYAELINEDKFTENFTENDVMTMTNVNGKLLKGYALERDEDGNIMTDENGKAILIRDSDDKLVEIAGDVADYDEKSAYIKEKHIKNAMRKLISALSKKPTPSITESQKQNTTDAIVKLSKQLNKYIKEDPSLQNIPTTYEAYSTLNKTLGHAARRLNMQAELDDIIDYEFIGDIDDLRTRILGLFSDCDRPELAASEVDRIFNETTDTDGEIDIDTAKQRFADLIDEFYNF
jgi:hypothetical protein